MSAAETPEPHPKPGRAPRCLVCGEGLAEERPVLCGGCGAPHHERCWGFNKGCATYACGSRVAVDPPGAHRDPAVFETRGRPSPFALGLVVLAFGVCFALLKPYLLLSKSLAKPLLKFLRPLFWTGVVGTLLGPLATRRRVLLDPVRGRVSRQLLLGPLSLQGQAGWGDFDEVAGLEVRHAEVAGLLPFGGRRGLEVWLRDVRGRRLLLTRGSWEDREAVLAEAREAAEVLDSTLRLPPGLAGAPVLEAGRALRLGAASRPALPEGGPGGLSCP